MTILHDTERLLPELSERLGSSAHARSPSAASRSNEHPGGAVSERGVMLNNGEFLVAATVICTIGTGQRADRTNRCLPTERGRIVVNPRPSVAAIAGRMGVGDCALVTNARRRQAGTPNRPVRDTRGEVRRQNLLATMAGRPTRRSATGRADRWPRSVVARGSRRYSAYPIGIAGLAPVARLLSVADAHAQPQAAYLRRMVVGDVVPSRHHAPALHAQPGSRTRRAQQRPIAVPMRVNSPASQMVDCAT